jgi:hypothetical protein
MPLRMNLRAYNGQYVCAEQGGGTHLVANRASPTEWETFGLLDPPHGSPIRSGDKVSIQVHNGMYVIARDGGGGAVNANATIASTWETFTILRADGSEGEISSGQPVAFKTYDDRHFLMAVNGGGGEVNAVSSQPTPREWETFTIDLGGPLPIKVETGRIRLDEGEWMEASAKFSNNGRLERRVHIWTRNEIGGFTGGCAIYFYDRDYNNIANSRLITYGVDGTGVPFKTSDRTVNDIDEIGQDIFNRCAGMQILLGKNPRSRLKEDIDEGVYVARAVIELIGEWKRQTEGSN